MMALHLTTAYGKCGECVIHQSPICPKGEHILDAGPINGTHGLELKCVVTGSSSTLLAKFAIHRASVVYILNDHMYSTFIISMSNLVHSISELFASLGNCTESLCKLGEQLTRLLSGIGL